jgi:hypothetical protein
MLNRLLSQISRALRNVANAKSAMLGNNSWQIVTKIVCIFDVQPKASPQNRREIGLRSSSVENCRCLGQPGVTAFNVSTPKTRPERRQCRGRWPVGASRRAVTALRPILAVQQTEVTSQKRPCERTGETACLRPISDVEPALAISQKRTFALSCASRRPYI